MNNCTPACPAPYQAQSSGECYYLTTTTRNKQCPAGQTCWPKDATGTFTCLNSAAGKAKGDDCTNIIGAPTCGDGLACFQGVGDPSGKCVAYCDPAKTGRGCAAGETCSTAMLSGSTNKFQICVGASTPKDAGADTSLDTGATGDTGAGDTGAGDTGASDTGASDAPAG